MKTKSIIFILAGLIFSVNLFAQPGKRMEKIKAQKVAYITKELDLTVEEAQVFWPVYNALSKKLDEIRAGKAELYSSEIRGRINIPEEESLVLVDKYLDFEVAEIDLKKEYHLKFKKVLPAHKILRLYIAENKFKLFLLNKLKDNKSTLFGF